MLLFQTILTNLLLSPISQHPPKKSCFYQRFIFFWAFCALTLEVFAVCKLSQSHSHPDLIIANVFFLNLLALASHFKFTCNKPHQIAGVFFPITSTVSPKGMNHKFPHTNKNGGKAPKEKEGPSLASTTRLMSPSSMSCWPCPVRDGIEVQCQCVGIRSAVMIVTV